MSKSKFGNSNLYMTTQEFADLVIESLHEQNYFKRDDVAHPQDIAYAFTTVGETIGNAMYWAIQQENQAAKEGKIKRSMMEPNDLRKAFVPTDDHAAPINPRDELI